MMWQRITCEKERNDSPGAKGTLILGDALRSERMDGKSTVRIS